MVAHVTAKLVYAHVLVISMDCCVKHRCLLVRIPPVRMVVSVRKLRQATNASALLDILVKIVSRKSATVRHLHAEMVALAKKHLKDLSVLAQSVLWVESVK